MKKENNKLKSYNDYYRKVGHIDKFPINMEESSDKDYIKINDPFKEYQEYIKICKEKMEEK